MLLDYQYVFYRRNTIYFRMPQGKTFRQLIPV